MTYFVRPNTRREMEKKEGGDGEKSRQKKDRGREGITFL
jgi:hypothetical protein